MSRNFKCVRAQRHEGKRALEQMYKVSGEWVSGVAPYIASISFTRVKIARQWKSTFIDITGGESIKFVNTCALH